jgi:FAD synthetase
MVFGTFDILHKGHLDFFRQARKLAKRPFLIVSIARDVNVKKIKGKKPILSEKKRQILVKRTGLANKVILGGLGRHLPHILRQKPDIIALGYDQKAYVKELKSDLKRRLLKANVVKLKPFRPDIYKSSKLNAHRNRGGAGK